MNRKKGVLTVISGPMFSGKTNKLLDIYKIQQKLGRKILAVKPNLDQRYSEKEMFTHDRKYAPAFVANQQKPEKVISKIISAKINLLIIDEVQFFHKTAVLKTIKLLLARGIDVVAAGLVYDYKRKLFGATQNLIEIADYHLALFSICEKCGGIAQYNERIKGSIRQIEIGAGDLYIAACITCHKIYV